MRLACERSLIDDHDHVGDDDDEDDDDDDDDGDDDELFMQPLTKT